MIKSIEYCRLIKKIHSLPYKYIKTIPDNVFCYISLMGIMEVT